MKIVKAFCFRVYPTESQVARLARWDDALRFLCLWRARRSWAPCEPGNGLDCVFHVVLSKAPASALRQAGVDYYGW